MQCHDAWQDLPAVAAGVQDGAVGDGVPDAWPWRGRVGAAVHVGWRDQALLHARVIIII